MRVMVLGTGFLGASIASKLLKSGHKVFVYNRTVAKTSELKKQGASVIKDLKDTEPLDCILLVLSDFKAIRSVLSKIPTAVLSSTTIIQMGTIAPAESKLLDKEIKTRGAHYFECPVLGSKSEALAGRLVLMMGGKKSYYLKWKKFFKALGQDIYHVGDVGHAAALKLALNNLIAMHAVGFSLSLALVRKNNIDVDMFTSILRSSVLYAPMFDKKLPNWLAHDYAKANFPTKHLLKDVRLVLSEAKAKKIKVDALTGIEKILSQAVITHANKDYSSVYETIAGRR